MSAREPATISDLVRDRAATSPDRVVLTFDEDTLTYAEWEARSAALARQLIELGVSKGDTVGVVLDTGVDAVMAWVAIARLGAVEVPISPALRGESLAHPLRAAEVRLVVSSGHYLPTLSSVVETIEPSVRLTMVDDDVSPYPGPATPQEDVAPGDPSVVLFSSGTTGPPKESS